jgi:hypothetical protein
LSAERAASTTTAPCFANARAAASPTPEDAPVTITTLPASDAFMGFSFAAVTAVIQSADLTFGKAKQPV